MRRYQAGIWSSVSKNITIIVLLIILMGILNIFSAVSEDMSMSAFFSLEANSGKQLIRLGLVSILIFLLFIITNRARFFIDIAYPMYFLGIAVLLVVLFIGKEVAGAKAWINLAGIRLQPSEFMKLFTALAVARFLSDHEKTELENWSVLIRASFLVILPMVLIVAQGDTGSALVFSSFLIVFYRRNMPKLLMAWIFSMGILFCITIFFYKEHTPEILLVLVALGSLYLWVVKRTKVRIFYTIAAVSVAALFVLSTKFILTDILKPHQRKRIELLVDPSMDPLGMGWQVTQSKIAIGSGGLLGKGYFKGTQTNFQFIPDQSTDFIFCTVAEEFGFIGSMFLVLLFSLLFYFILQMAESQNHYFSKTYAYCVFSILFFHFFVNVGMTMGLVPVIGIPLPLVSYGGSSLISTLLLVGILLKLDFHNDQYL